MFTKLAILALSALAPHSAPPKVVLFCERGCPVFNVHAPSRLDMWMNGGGTLAQIRVRCDELGGDDLIQVRGTHNLVCEGVDY